MSSDKEKEKKKVHRRALQEQRLLFVQEVIEQELAFCTRVNKYHPRNYYLWTYRLKLVKEILMPLIHRCPAFQETLLLNEITNMRKYIKDNPSDSSAKHYFK